MKNDVWDVIPRPQGKYILTSKWIYKIKHAADGSIEKYNARFMAHGFSQKEGIDYEETFAPIARYTSIISVLSLDVVMKWKIHQMDFKTAFMNGVVEEEVYTTTKNCDQRPFQILFQRPLSLLVYFSSFFGQSGRFSTGWCF